MSSDETSPDQPAGDQPGGMDFGALLSQLGQVQQNLVNAQEEVAALEVEGTAGGGAVRVRVTGAMEFVSVTISPEVVDPGDVDMLADLVLAAVRDAVDAAHDAQRRIMGSVDPSGGEGPFGALGGLLGGQPDA